MAANKYVSSKTFTLPLTEAMITDSDCFFQ